MQVKKAVRCSVLRHHNLLSRSKLHGRQDFLRFPSGGHFNDRPQCTGTGWSTLGESFRAGRDTSLNPSGAKGSIGFPSSGWDSEIDGSSWKLSNWLGSYEPTFAPWIYHSSLGWIYIHQADFDSMWLWKDELGWLWTNQDFFPYLRQNLPASWLSLKPESYQPALLYDFPNQTWFELGTPLIEVVIDIMPSGSGVVDGMKNVSKGESLALFARPQKGHIFTGWTGDIQSADNPLYLREISSNFNVTANFESVRDFLSSGKIDSSLSWLPSEKLRDKAILELAAFGYSSVLFLSPARRNQPPTLQASSFPWELRTHQIQPLYLTPTLPF